MSTPTLTPASLFQLACFVRVVEAGSFAEAGRRLGMTTSGISKAISRFERTHGVRLLHRSTHALSPTEEGEHLLEEARETLRGLDQLGAVLSQTADGGRAGRVRISAPPGFVRACLLPALPRLLERHPEIQLDVRVSYRMVDLADEGVDLALRSGQTAGLQGHVSQTLFSFSWRAFATPGYLARRGAPASPDDLATHDLIGFRNGGSGRVGAWRFRDPASGNKVEALRRETDAQIVFDDGSAAYDLAGNGHGIVWAPEWLARDDLRSGRVVEVLREWRSDAEPMLVVRRDRRLTPQRTRVVINFLHECSGLWHGSEA